MTLEAQDVIDRFPEFANAGDLIAICLEEARLEVSAEAFGDKYDTALGFMTAHKLATSPYGMNQRFVDAPDEVEELKRTSYGRQFLGLTARTIVPIMVI